MLTHLIRLHLMPVTGLVGVLFGDRPSWLAGAGIALGILAGALAVLASLLFFRATDLGLLSIVGVLVSLYPVVTVVLAWTVFRERAHRLQVIGMLLCAVSVAAIVLT